MLKQITIAKNSIDPETWETFECENILDFLMAHYKEWPDNTRIYNMSVCDVCDVTPHDEKDVQLLLGMEGPFYVITYPGWEAVPYILMAIVAIVSILNAPKIPNTVVRDGSDAPSSNNGLSDRSNKARINGRIPDIFGQVRSVPDLLCASYKEFENNVEVEHSYLSVGRGYYQINETEIFEETTPIPQIVGSSVEVYAPFTSPNQIGVTPQLTIGVPIATKIRNVKPYSSVNNQIVDLLSASEYSADETIFAKDGHITIPSSMAGKFPLNSTIISTAQTQVWVPGDPSTQDNPYGTPGYYDLIYDFTGSYLVTEITGLVLTVATTWPDMPEDTLAPTEGVLRNSNSQGVGPFVVDVAEDGEVWCNFIAPNGIYKDDGSTKTALPIEVAFRIESIDHPELPAEVTSCVLLWNEIGSVDFGKTLKVTPSFNGKCNVSVKRLTDHLIIPGTQLYDEIRWRDLYTVSDVSNTDFGNVTTIQTKTTNFRSNSSSQRKLNAIVTRKLPRRVSGSTFTTELYATTSADEILSAICLDPKLGNRQPNEVDFDNIYATVAEMNAYFGTTKCSEFCYTFDKSNLSFEETIQSLASSIFSLAYRKGNKIRLSFERAQSIPTILFNHRNKIPGTEARSINFGNIDDSDGIELQYVDPSDDSIISFFVPENQSYTKPKVIESIGIRNAEHAHITAYRAYNKLIYQNSTVGFEATQEASIALINDKILVSDGTRSKVVDGEVISQNLLDLTLSQNIELLDDVSYTIFLQMTDGTVESIPIVKSTLENHVLLTRAPALPLALGTDLFAKTTFLISSNDDIVNTAFILTEKQPKGVLTCEVTAINYDERYYQNDLDFKP